MISEKIFKYIVVATLLWIPLAVALSLMLPSDLSPILLEQSELALGAEWDLYDSITTIMVAAAIIANFFLLFYKLWAWWLYIVLVPIISLSTIFEGPVVISSIDAFLFEIDVFFSAMLWAILLFSNIKSCFFNHAST